MELIEMEKWRIIGIFCILSFLLSNIALVVALYTLNVTIQMKTENYAYSTEVFYNQNYDVYWFSDSQVNWDVSGSESSVRVYLVRNPKYTGTRTVTISIQLYRGSVSPENLIQVFVGGTWKNYITQGSGYGKNGDFWTDTYVFGWNKQPSHDYIFYIRLEM